MKLKTLFSFAMMAVLLVAGHVYAQNPYYSPATAQASPAANVPVAAASPSYFMGADGQAYMMVPDTSAIPTTFSQGNVDLAAYAAGACGCGDKGCAGKACGGCDSRGCCDKGCGGCCNSCCSGGFCHRIAVFGEYMSLRARDAEVPFAVRFNGPVVQPGNAPSVPIQTSAIANLDPDYDSGFRAGFGFSLDACNELRLTYSMFDTSQSGFLSAAATADPNDLVRSMVQHPSTFNAGADGLLANGRHDIDFDLIDIDFRHLFSYSCRHQYGWLIGARYAKLKQDFESQFAVNNTRTVTTDIDMDGFGVRLGFDGERYFMDRQLLGYLRANSSFVASEFRAAYAQGTNFDASVVDTSYTAGRIVTMLDLEIGGGWQSACGNWRITGGYLINAWFNTIKTDEWINGVQNNNYLDLGSTMTFDGFVGRVEARF